MECGHILPTRSKHDPFPGVPQGLPLRAVIAIDGEQGRIDGDLRDNIDEQKYPLLVHWQKLAQDSGAMPHASFIMK